MNAVRKPFDGRRAAIAKVKIAAKDLQIEDGAYRAMLERLTGRTSAADCTEAQLGVVLDELKAKGWKPKVVQGGRAAPRGRPGRAEQPVARKARAMWISLHQLGAVRDPSEAALEAFARRQLGVDRLRWAVASEANALIEALKKMAERAGWSQDLTGVPSVQHVAVLKARLADAIDKARG